MGGDAEGERDAAVASDTTQHAEEARAWTIVNGEEALHAALGEAIVDWAG